MDCTARVYGMTTDIYLRGCCGGVCIFRSVGELYCQRISPLSEDILAGYPRGQGTQILFVGGQPSNLQESAIGTMVEVHVDHGAGTLGFCINGGPYVEAIKGFPPDVLLRPWALCLMPEDSVRFVGFLSTRC